MQSETPGIRADLRDSTHVSVTLGSQQPAAFSLHSWEEKVTCPVTGTQRRFCLCRPGLTPLPHRCDFRLLGAGRSSAHLTPLWNILASPYPHMNLFSYSSSSRLCTPTQPGFLTSLYMLMGSYCVAVILQPNQPVAGKQEDFLSSLAFSLSTALGRISIIPGLDISTAQRVCVTSPKAHSNQHQNFPRSKPLECQPQALLLTHWLGDYIAANSQWMMTAP